MATCDACGRSENMPYHCRHCGGTYCGEHRLPESHDCPGLDDWDDPSGVFDSGFDDSVDNPGTRSSDGVLSRVFDTGVGGPLGYFRGNMTYVFLGLMFITFALQNIARFVLVPVGSLAMTFSSYQTYATLFVLSSQQPLHVWTWFTSIFAHGGFGHILLNAIVLYIFGPPLDHYLGSKRFTALFLVSGAAAGLAQVVVGPLLGVPVSGVLGASGAIMAVMAVLTVLKPNTRIHLWAILPIPLWALTAVYTVLSVSGVFVGGGNVANLAHLAGLAIGLVYGIYVKDRQGVPERLRFEGGLIRRRGRGRGPF